MIGKDEFFWWGNLQIGNPSFECFYFLGRELFFWRHVWVGIDLNNLVKRTCLGIPWNEGSVGLAAIWLWLCFHMKRLARDPKKHEYRDVALTPPENLADEDLGLMTETTGAKAQAEKQRRKVEIISAAKKWARAAAAS